MTSERAYILLRTLDENPELVAESLNGLPGVVAADAVDGSLADVVVVLEGADWPELTQQAINAASSVENTTWFVSWLMARSKGGNVPLARQTASRAKDDF